MMVSIIGWMLLYVVLVLRFWSFLYLCVLLVVMVRVLMMSGNLVYWCLRVLLLVVFLICLCCMVWILILCIILLFLCWNFRLGMYWMFCGFWKNIWVLLWMFVRIDRSVFWLWFSMVWNIVFGVLVVFSGILMLMVKIWLIGQVLFLCIGYLFDVLILLIISLLMCLLKLIFDCVVDVVVVFLYVE